MHAALLTFSIFKYESILSIFCSSLSSSINTLYCCASSIFGTFLRHFFAKSSVGFCASISKSVNKHSTEQGAWPKRRRWRKGHLLFFMTGAASLQQNKPHSSNSFVLEGTTDCLPHVHTHVVQSVCRRLQCFTLRNVNVFHF